MKMKTYQKTIILLLSTIILILSNYYILFVRVERGVFFPEDISYVAYRKYIFPISGIIYGIILSTMDDFSKSKTVGILSLLNVIILLAFCVFPNPYVLFVASLEDASFLLNLSIMLSDFQICFAVLAGFYLGRTVIVFFHLHKEKKRNNNRPEHLKHPNL